MACFLLRPAGNVSKLASLFRKFGVGPIPSILSVRHPSLPEDPADDITVYRRQKAAVGALVRHRETERMGTLVDDIGNEVWRIRNEVGALEDVSAYDLSLGRRESEYFMEYQVVNNLHGRNAFMWVWPADVTHLHIRARVPNRPLRIEVDKGMTIRDVYNTAFVRYTEAAKANETPEEDNEEPDLAEMRANLTDIDGQPYVRAAVVRVGSDRVDEDVPLLIAVPDAVQYGQSVVPQLPRVDLFSAYFLFVAGVGIVAALNYSLDLFRGLVWYKHTDF